MKSFKVEYLTVAEMTITREITATSESEALKQANAYHNFHILVSIKQEFQEKDSDG